FIFPRPQAGGDRRDFRPLASDSGWKIPRDWPTILARSPLKDSIVAIPRPRALDQALRTGHSERAEQLVRRLVSAGLEAGEFRRKFEPDRPRWGGRADIAVLLAGWSALGGS